jgi:hypothetical protein
VQIFVEGERQIVDEEQMLVAFRLVGLFVEVDDELPAWEETYISVNSII